MRPSLIDHSAVELIGEDVAGSGFDLLDDVGLAGGEVGAGD